MHKPKRLDSLCTKVLLQRPITVARQLTDYLLLAAYPVEGRGLLAPAALVKSTRSLSLR